MQDNINQSTVLASGQGSVPNVRKTNKLLPAVIILAVLAVAGIGGSIWGLINANSQKDEINGLREQLVTDNTVYVNDSEVIETPNDGADGDADSAAPTPTTVTRVDILNSVPENLLIKEHKSLNSDAVRPALAVNFSGAIEFSGDNGDLADSWTVMIDWDKVNSWYGLDNGKTGTEVLKEVKLGLGGEFTDVYCGVFGQVVGDETVLFLMKDGTVEYIPLRKALKENNLKSYGKLSGVEHVIKFYQANMNGGITLAQRADGDYYNLYYAIQATGNY